MLIIVMIITSTLNTVRKKRNEIYNKYYRNKNTAYVYYFHELQRDIHQKHVLIAKT